MTPTGGQTSPSFSVVIPANDEATVISRCLDSILPWSGPLPPEIIVVANGCTDETAARARATTGVVVIELVQGSKRGALNAGDSAASFGTRVYLDADVVLARDALQALVQVLDTDRAIAAAPVPRFVLEGRPWTVRAFYSVYRELPYVRNGLIGLGVVGLSAAGRRRFGDFPDAIADDLFVQRLFAPSERVVLQEHVFDVETPRSLRSLVVVRTRTAQGNAQLAETAPGEGDFAPTTGGTVRALVALVARDLRLLPAALVYAGITVAARRRATRTDQVWHRDATTR
jgi:glycosyltransferase involved in cell wall biosynthesis